jgi:hypothetical protein
MEGRWDQAGVVWDRVLAEHPRDPLAIQLGHLTDFYLGEAVNLRDRIGRVIGHWDRDTPGYSFILGMQAFGLEECSQFEPAEQAALEALSMDARDGWSVHAEAHALEMRNRYREGQEFMRSRVDDWAPDNGFAFHNWWYLGLFHLEEEDFGATLELYDERILPGESEVSLQMLDASAMLWRLYLHGLDLGDRWQRIADLWTCRIPHENGDYAFNDLHAIIALVGAGRLAEAREVLADLEKAAMHNPALTRMMARDVGVPAAGAMIAFAEARYADAIDSLYPIRACASRFGGSNAQRDILGQTLIESAIRAGQSGLASNLLNEREVHRPFNPLTRRYRAKLAH